MDKRPIKVTGPKHYHLRGHQNHFPRANLEGASDADAAKKLIKKTAWKLAADYSTDEERQIQQYWMEQARKRLGPEASRTDIEMAGRAMRQSQGHDEGAASRALQAKLDYAGTDAPRPFDGRAGVTGFTDPVGSTFGRAMGSIVPGVAGGLLAPADPINRDGSLNPNGVTNGDPAKLVAAQGNEQIADLLGKRDMALQQGNTQLAEQLENQYKALKFQDPAVAARGAGAGVGADIGSQLSDVVSAPFGVGAAAAQNAIGAGLNTGWNAYRAEPGHRLEAVGDTVKQVLPGVAQGTANIAALSRLPGLSNPGVGGVGRLGTMAKNLTNSGTIMRGGALVGGVQGLADLGRWATGNEDFDRAREAELRQATMAADGRGGGQVFKDWAGGGVRAALTGNLAPARAQVGLAVGEALPDADQRAGVGAPAARAVRQAKLDMGAQRASGQGYEQTRELLMQDPRFQGLDPRQIDDLAARGAEHASSASLIDQQVQGNGQPNQASTQALTRYTEAVDRYHQNKASPQDIQYLEELAGSPAQDGKLDPAQLQAASRNAMLYHRFGAQTAKQLAGGARPDLEVAQAPAASSQQAPLGYGRKPDYQQLVDHMLANGNDTSAAQHYVDYVSKLPDQEKSLALKYLVEQKANQGAAGTANKAINAVTSVLPGLSGVLPTSTDNMTDEQRQKLVMDQVAQRGQQAGHDLQGSAEKDWGDQQSGGWMNYLKNNPSLGLLPVGLIGMMSGSKVGKVLGMMAMMYGAYNLYQRYQGMQDPKFQQAAQARASAQAAGTWDQTREQQFQAEHGDKWRDLQAAHHMGTDIEGRVKQEYVKRFQTTLPGQQPKPVSEPQGDSPAVVPPATPVVPQGQPQAQPAAQTPPNTPPVAQQAAAAKPPQQAPVQPQQPQQPQVAKAPAPAGNVAQTLANRYTPKPQGLTMPPKPLIQPPVPAKIGLA